MTNVIDITRRMNAKPSVLFSVLLTCAAMTSARADLNLNGVWQFRFDEGRAITNVSSSTFEATGVMTVPGCFDAMPGATYMKRGTALYRRTFDLVSEVPAAWLVIDGMGLYGRFWIDGREIGKDDLPYSRVEIPTGRLTAGRHTLVAAVDNRFDWSYNKLVRPYYDFHFWGGFYHGVSLSFDNRKLFVRTRDYATGEIEIEIAGEELKPNDKVEVRTLVFDGKNEVKASFRNGRATVRVPNFKLWSPDSPNLHTVTVATDSPTLLSARFGIRTIEAIGGGFRLNGQRIFLKGANRHEQQPIGGAATSATVMLADILNLKALGGNFIRGAHYPQAQAFLDLCDEAGVLVWEESLGWGNGQKYTYPRTDGNNELLDATFRDKQVEQTRLMVRNSFNHPSVIIFAFLNECDSRTEPCRKLVERLVTAIRAEDSGRLVSFACNMTKDDICHSLTDFVAFNTYPGTINSHPGLHDELKDKIRNQPGYGVNWVADYFQKRYPGKTLFISEMGSSAQYGVRDPSAPNATEEFQAEHNALVAEAAWTNPAIAGIAFWQLCDNRTCGRECGYDGLKRQATSIAGQFDMLRRPKLVTGVLRDWFTNRTPANITARHGSRPERSEVGAVGGGK